ncbi:N-acetyltransferase [Aggregicoccus sp. 17bor-14]|uniref:N-acetyltransferase n=1 Tax=Myxococcaceae TaxID=31 RepID=UPI00129D0D2D|nr:MULTISPECIES: N-acetyltransferase [Myxococcaceae]MBF5040854.1 N-acetyltransferase [Simulacricoccus sp. 17bor-14]MRI86643.1 N-acetyltransferase [Aggregicoccus sp. 17bor-14]
MALPAEQQALELPPVPADVSITPVRGAADREAFIRFPYALYRHDPHWVPPLEMERKDFLDPKKNPWFEFGEVELYLARRGGEVVGRIAAVKDPRYNEYHGTTYGFFGLFDCVNEPGVARGLFDAASSWLKARGFTEVLGPASFSSNYEFGLLVEGFDSSPAILMPYNPGYYPGLLEACGFRKAKDLWAFELSASATPPEKVVRIAEKMRKREGITVRPVRMKELSKEIALIKDIYNAAWERNWGFVPMTDHEFDHLARELKAIVRPDLVLIAEVKGEPVAFSMTLPDANYALKAAGGRLTRYGLPIGLAKLVLASRRIERLRLITLGIKEGYRRRGLDAILYLDTLRTAHRLGYRGGEISWTLEDNHLVNRAIESMGGQRSKTYRIYQRAL